MISTKICGSRTYTLMNTEILCFLPLKKFRRDMIKTSTKEDREIEANFRSEDKDDIAALLYTNSVLNVGNFIKP